MNTKYRRLRDIDRGVIYRMNKAGKTQTKIATTLRVSDGTGYILSIYERKSRTGLITKLETKCAESTAWAIIKRLRGYRVETLTYDNGLEFAGHETVSKELNERPRKILAGLSPSELSQGIAA